MLAFFHGRTEVSARTRTEVGCDADRDSDSNILRLGDPDRAGRVSDRDSDRGGLSAARPNSRRGEPARRRAQTWPSTAVKPAADT